ncbi:MAG: hypothetical protein CR984_00890 [Proteobacteria bacterium]|nr:MAG: hypothetical protein CR984_00890 [Pseudomonadota bacterium]
MATIHIDNLEPGMVLASDVTDTNGRMLLSKGASVDTKHLNMFKMWGVREVRIQQSGDADGKARHAVDPETMRKVAESLQPAFGDNDLTHPAVGEIFRQAVIHRSNRNHIRKSPSASVPAGDELPGSDANMRNKVGRRDIKLPESPSLVLKLNDTIADPFSSADDIARVISTSPGLSAMLLRIVNSAFYGFPSRIDSVNRAVTIIGSKEVSALAVGITTMEMFKNIPASIFDLQAFTHHSLACGVLARTLATSGNIRNTEQFFVSGLLHDIGRMVVFKYYSRHAMSMLGQAADKGPSLYDVEKSVLGFRHTDIAGDLFKKWKFPVGLSQNVVYHHRPAAAQDPDKAAIVHLADIIAHSLGEGKSGEWRIPPLDQTAWDKLKLPPKTLSTAIPQAIEHLEFLLTVFQAGD